MGKKSGNTNRNGATKSPKNGKREKAAKDTTNNNNQSSTSLDLKHVGITVLLFAVAAYLHYQHATYMFESDKHFSHLSNLERELSFRTEMGLYYSYFKTLIEAPTFLQGIGEITSDNITEYPNVINTLQRFNLYPEVMTAILYRNFRWFTDLFSMKTQQCWQINRGQGRSPVVSCEGWGDPMYFYVGVVYILSGLMMGVFYLYGASLSDSYSGGILAVAAYFLNHGECTRVQWTPALRESFAQPFLIVQMCLTSILLRRGNPANWLTVSNALSSLVFILFWQFSPFALTTQIIAITSIYIIDLLPRPVFTSYLISQALALGASYILLFGNKMLLCSLMTSSLLAAFLVVNTEPVLHRIKIKVLRWIVCLCHFLILTVCLKIVLSKLLHVEDDAHIVDILRSKFTNFSTFHTKLYTCAVEFDFLSKETYLLLCQTILLPAAGVTGLVVLYRMVKYAFFSGELDAAIVYNVVQLLAYTIMAALIMRLKLFMTPQLCIVAALLASKKILPIKSDNVGHAFIGLLLASMCVKGTENLTKQWAIKGEFSNVPMEELVEWVNQTTPNSVFGGSMPLMATIKLTTKRPIVNHPHYEDAGLRRRTEKIYTIFSRKPLREVYENLVDLKVDYVVVDKNWCTGRMSTGCGLSDIWDEQEPEYKDGNVACVEMSENPKPYFTPVKGNMVYRLFKVNKFPNT